jgi:hypothetical protein
MTRTITIKEFDQLMLIVLSEKPPYSFCFLLYIGAKPSGSTPVKEVHLDLESKTPETKDKCL